MKPHSVILLVGLLSSITSPCLAAEGGGTSYAPGSSMYLAGDMPPPGFYEILMPSYTHQYRINDANGNKNSALGKVDISVPVLTSRSFYVTPYQIFGAQLATQLVVPVVGMDGSMSGSSYVSPIDESNFGLGDVTFSPAILGWHITPNWSVNTGLDINMPTGRYDASRSFNPGRNYWSFQPVLGTAYIDRTGLQAHALARLQFNTENEDTNYKTGTEFEVDYTLAYNFEKFRVGLTGYYYKQLGNDTQNGAIYEDGNKGESLAIGPALTYKWGFQEATISWQHDLYSENRGQGDYIYGQVAFKLF